MQLIFLWIFMGAVIGFFVNQLLHDKFSRIHVDIISGAVGAPLGVILSNPFGGTQDIGAKITTFIMAIGVAIIAVFLSRVAKL